MRINQRFDELRDILSEQGVSYKRSKADVLESVTHLLRSLIIDRDSRGGGPPPPRSPAAAAPSRARHAQQRAPG